jgi:hypothetical protein
MHFGKRSRGHYNSRCVRLDGSTMLVCYFNDGAREGLRGGHRHSHTMNWIDVTFSRVNSNKLYSQVHQDYRLKMTKLLPSPFIT